MGYYAIIFASSFLIVFASSWAEKSNIVNNTLAESWMSKKNLRTLVQVSYAELECMNIYICDKSAETERLFKEFIGIYTLEYTLNSGSNYCTNDFVVARSEATALATLVKVSTINYRPHMLIIIAGFVESPGDVLYRDDDWPGLFGNLKWRYADVNIVARNCMWTVTGKWPLPQIGDLKKVSKYDDMAHRRDRYNFQGILLNVSTVYNPPFSFLQSTVKGSGNRIKGDLFIARNESELDGVELQLFLLFAKRLNFTYLFIKPSDGFRYGEGNESWWTGGLIGQMRYSGVELAFGSIPYTMEHYIRTDMTTPWRELHLNFLVPRPKAYKSFWALTTPLSPAVWGAVISMLIAQTVCVYARALVNPRVSKRFRNFPTAWTEMIGRLIGACTHSKTQGLKFQILIWHFIGVLVVTAYSSSLAAKLAGTTYDKRIDTLQDFIEANLTWGFEESEEPSSFFDMSDPYAKQFPDRFKRETSESERHEKILKGNYAILGYLVDSSFFPYNSIRIGDLKNYRLMKQSISSYFATFAIRLWMVEPMNMILLWMQETGLVQYHLNDVLSRRTAFGLREVMIEHDVNNNDDAKILELKPLGAAFVLYVVGIGIAIIVFYLELRSVRGLRSIRDVLLDIECNRKNWHAKELKRKRLHSLLWRLNRNGKQNCNAVS